MRANKEKGETFGAAGTVCVKSGEVGSMIKFRKLHSNFPNPSNVMFTPFLWALLHCDSPSASGQLLLGDTEGLLGVWERLEGGFQRVHPTESTHMIGATKTWVFSVVVRDL